MEDTERPPRGMAVSGEWQPLVGGQWPSPGSKPPCLTLRPEPAGLLSHSPSGPFKRMSRSPIFVLQPFAKRLCADLAAAFDLQPRALVLRGGLERLLRLQFAVALEAFGGELAGSGGGSDGAARFRRVAAVAEAAALGERFDVGKRARHGARCIPQLQLPHARRGDQNPAGKAQDGPAAGGPVS